MIKTAAGISLALLLTVSPLAAVEGPYVSAPVVPGISPAVRDLPVAPVEKVIPREINPRENPLEGEPDQGRRGTWDRTSVPVDPLIAMSVNPNGRTPDLEFSFETTGNPVGCGGCTPPDVVGAVGPNHYVHMVNATKVAIYSKTGTLLAGPFNLGTLWSSGGCTGNAGDPVPVYDSMADRWLLSQFTGGGHICAAISQTPDPTGAYFLYDFAVSGGFPDYFKFGAWPDAYYMSANQSSYSAFAFDRINMLAGSAATFIRFGGQNNFLLPADVDGPTPPPGGAPGLFFTFKDNSFHGGVDRLEVFEFDADFAVPGNSTFVLADTINVASFTYTPCGFFNFNCMRQLGTGQRFDALGEWPMFRFPYRNFGTHETLVGTYVVGGGLGDVGAALRWFELRKTASDWTLFQEGTYDPGDGNDRSNPSIAMDEAGNIALGFTVSSSAVHPQVHYTTRSPGDPLGTMGPEKVIIDGGGSQTGSNRWGDYAAMDVDPADDCTFYYTNMYHDVDSGTGWNTLVGAFGLCGGIFSDDFESGDTSQWDQTIP